MNYDGYESVAYFIAAMFCVGVIAVISGAGYGVFKLIQWLL